MTSRFFLSIIATLLITFYGLATAATFKPNTQYQVCFTPYENCTQLIVNHIHDAKSSILVQAYSFTSRKIAHALVAAHDRGIDVKVIFDKSNFNCHQFSFSSYLIKHGVPAWDDNKLNIAHNKVMVFDGNTVETGSFNFTKSAQFYNAENVLIINSKTLAKDYTANWNRRRTASRKIAGVVCKNRYYY